MKKSDNGEKKNSGKFAGMYMAIGMCLGCGIGMAFGNFLFDNISLGMCFGLSIGLALGAAYGASLDKKSLNVVEIIEEDFGCEGVPEDGEATVTVVVTDTDGKEQRIRMADKLCYERNIEVGDAVMLDNDGTLKQIYKLPDKKKK